MKYVFKLIWFYICIWLVIVFILSSISCFIKPASFSFISLLGIGFPYILATFCVFIIINFFVRKKLGFFISVFLPLAYFNAINTFALRPAISWQIKKDSSALRVMTWNV